MVSLNAESRLCKSRNQNSAKLLHSPNRPTWDSLSSLIRFLWSLLFLSFNWVGFWENGNCQWGLSWVDEHGRPCLRPFRGSLPLTCSFYSSTTLGGASVLHHCWVTCPFYSSTTGGQEPNTLVLALCTLHRWIYLHLQWMGGSQAKRWGVRSSMMRSRQ